MKYAQVLETVKQNIDPTEIGVEIQDVQKTRNGELLLTVQNGPEKLEALKKAIEDKVPEAAASTLTTKKVLHLKDLDGITTVDEIKKAIVDIVPTSETHVEIRALRPAYAGKQNVTVVLPEVEATKLTQIGHIKIGWTKCRVLERKPEIKCSKCWQHGHKRGQCIGPNRDNLCIKCGQERHKAVECQNTAYCIFCKKEGHQSSNAKCPLNKNKDSRKSEQPRQGNDSK